jgi:hypothetical protein
VVGALEAVSVPLEAGAAEVVGSVVLVLGADVSVADVPEDVVSVGAVAVVPVSGGVGGVAGEVVVVVVVVVAVVVPPVVPDVVPAELEVLTVESGATTVTTRDAEPVFPDESVTEYVSV